MTLNFRAGALVAAAGTLAIAVPAAAHPGGSNNPQGNGAANGASHSSGSHRCKPHDVGYIVHGTIDSSQGAMTVTNDTIASGTLVVDVTHTNHWARNDKTATQPVSYQVGPATKVKFDGGATDFSSGERVNLIGKALVITNRHCTGAGTVGTVTVRLVVVHPAAS